ncbi:hypothetical protein GCM10027594_10620 [Hymenobacter agri]
MKNWLTPVAVAAFACSALVSCKKDEVKVTAAPSGSITLTSSGNSAVLLQANEAQNAFTFTWNPISVALSDGSKAPAVAYQIQVAKTADGFGYPGTIDAGSGTSKAVTVKSFNEALTFIGLTPKVSSQVYVRVAAVVGTDAHTFVSNAVPLTVTSYQVCLPPNSDTWALIGPAGVDWNTDVPLTWDCDAKAYVARMPLKADEFKFRQNGAWTVNLGGTGNLTQGVPLTLGGSNIKITTAGTYTIKLVVAGSGAGVTGGTVTVTP